jgi:hypothetical protein
MKIYASDAPALQKFLRARASGSSSPEEMTSLRAAAEDEGAKDDARPSAATVTLLGHLDLDANAATAALLSQLGLDESLQRRPEK